MNLIDTVRKEAHTLAMRYAITALIVLGACGKMPSVPAVPGTGSDTTSQTQAPVALSKMTVCTEGGTDGDSAPYTIEYTYKEYADGTKETDCGITKGYPSNLSCPKENPYFLRYYINYRIPTHAGGGFTRSTMPINTTFVPTGAQCKVTTY